MTLSSLKVVMYSISLVILLLFSTFSMYTSDATSVWHQSKYEDFRDGYFDNVTLKDKGIEIELSLGNIPVNWTEMKPSSSPSYNWYGGGMETIWGTDEVLHYNYNAETWTYNLSSNNWTKKSPADNPGSSPYYYYYYRHSNMASIYGTDKVVLFGGYNQNPPYYWWGNETWIYDLSEDSWTQINTTMDPYTGYWGSLSTIWGTDKVLMFGGYGYYGPSYYSNTWVFDLSEKNWTKMAPVTKPDYYNYYYYYSNEMTSIWGTDKVLLYGGYSTTGWQSTTWVYDLSEDNWTEKKPSSSPPARYLHSMASVYGHNKIVLFGGYSATGYQNDLWIYDLDLNTWTQEFPIKSPSVRCWPAMTSFWGRDKAVLFSGWDGTGMLTDTWILNLNFDTRYKNGSYISPGHDSVYNSAFKSFEWNADLTENTSIRFQFRTADSQTGLWSKSFVGPDGTGSTYYESTSSALWDGHYNGIWVQYKAYFTSTSRYDTSYLKNVTITYNNLPITSLKKPSAEAATSINAPEFEWGFLDHDSASQGAFQVVIDNESSFNDIDFDSGEQISCEQFWQFPNGTAYSVIPDGTWYWKIRTKDIDGDWGTYSSPRKLIVDTQLPSTVITKPTNTGFYRYLTELSGVAADPTPASGLDRVELSLTRLLDNFTWTGKRWENGENWFSSTGTNLWSYDSSVIEWTSNNWYILKSRGVDNASNIETEFPKNAFMIDFEWPTSKVDFPKADSYVNELNTIVGSATDKIGSGISSVELTIQRLENELYWTGFGWDVDRAWLEAEGTTNWSFDSTTVPWTTDKYYRLETRATDLTGNVEYVSSGTRFMYDDRAPEFSFSINNDAKMANYPKVNLLISASDFGSGVNMMALSDDGVLFDDWKTFNDKFIYDLPGNDGPKSIHIMISDRAGNIAGPRIKSILLDTTPPENVSIIIDNGAENTNSLIVDLALTAEDKLSGIDKISLGYDGVSWSDWEPFREEMPFPLEKKNGRKKIFLRVTDVAGNMAKALDDIILDTEPPEPVLIFINRNDETTDSVDVKLTIHAEDRITGVSLMAFSEDGMTWSEWEKYRKTNSMPYTLSSGDGTKFVYFKVKDRAGNIAEAASDSITLDTSVPEIEEERAVITDAESNTFIYILIIIAIVVASILIAAISYTRRKKRHKAEREAVEKPAQLAQVAKPSGPSLPESPRAPQLQAATSGPPESQPMLPQAAASAATSEPAKPGDQPSPQLPPAWNILFDPEKPEADKEKPFPCSRCGEPLDKVSEGRFYCNTCQKYE